jgi:feruloyl esterase
MPTSRRSLPALAVALAAALLAALAVAVPLARPAQAATLTQVTGFGSNPGNLAMYAYRPDSLPSGAPLVVALHGCTQSASAYHQNSGWRELADRYGFAVVYPQQSSANAANACFNWFTRGDVERGQGEALSIKQMVDAAVTSYGLDARRVHVTGLSAGGAMAAVMLATYPDVFESGSVVAGLPYGCAPATSPYTCMNPGVDKSPAQWGALVRAAYPGHAGPWPRVSIWHGTGDYVVRPVNATESRDQWTDVHGIGTAPSSTESWPAGTTVENHVAGGRTVVRVQLVAGMGHGTPVDPGTAGDQCGAVAAYFLDTICSAYRDAQFFGLTGAAPPPSPGPTPTATATPSPTSTAPAECVTASTYAHTTAGRAYVSLGYAYAVGSGDLLGLWNTFTIRSLEHTGPDRWVRVDSC